MTDSPICCAVCLNIDNSRRVTAESIVGGYSVCGKHAELAGRPDFDIFKVARRG